MTQEKGIPYRRHKPSAALREFLDPLDPGSYFDCGQARLHGLDEALLREAESRGRRIGDDSFQLVATDNGLIFCRASISFAIAARWDEIALIRPHGDDPVVLPVNWPTHGELKFTVSKRLAANVFRRWLQLRMKTERISRQEMAARFSKVETGEWEVVAKVEPAEPPVESTIPDVDRRAGGRPRKRQARERAGLAKRGRKTATRGSAAVGDPTAARDPSAIRDRLDVRERQAVSEEPTPPTVPTRPTPPTAPATAAGPADDTAAASADDTAPSTAATAPADDIVVIPASPAAAEPAMHAPADGLDAEAMVIPEEDEPHADDPVLAPEAIVIEGGETPSPGLSGPPPSLLAPPQQADGGPGPSEIGATAPDPRPGPTADPPIRVIDPPEPVPPAWIGSPASLVGALVVISTLVLVTTVAVNSYRRTVGDDVDPAGPGAVDSAVGRTTIDHRRFNPVDRDGETEGAIVVTTALPDGADLDGVTPDGAGATGGTTLSPTAEGRPRLCNSNYSGCVPDVSDVDCPNDGDGPLYSTEPAVVMGDDIYELDTDGDGETCEPDQPRLADRDLNRDPDPNPNPELESDSGG